MGMFGSQCQSCGMPLVKDKLGGGTEHDGTTSYKYCSHCYLKGQFIDPNITLAEMQKKVQAKICASGLPKFIAKLFTRSMGKLYRWKTLLK